MGEGVEIEITPLSKGVCSGDPGREASSIPGVLPGPSVMMLWLWLSDFFHMTSVLCLVIWGWGEDVNIKCSLPKPLSFPLH